MASSPFTFTLEFEGPNVHVPLLEQLTDALLHHLGCSAAAVAELSAALERAIAAGARAGAVRCDLRFRTHDRTVDILVSADGGHVWQTSYALP